MKKIIALIGILGFIFTQSSAIAESLYENENEVMAPVWEEYVPKKYQNPRSFPSKGKNIAELCTGVVLTELLITSPIGIPMIVHSTTKMKNQGWYEKKKIYEAGLIEAETITDPVEKQEFYENLKKKCKFTEKRHKKQLKKMRKNNKKAKSV